LYYKYCIYRLLQNIIASSRKLAAVVGKIRLPINTILVNIECSRTKLQSLGTAIIEIQGLEDENVRLATTLQQGRKAFVRICNRMDVLFASAEPKGPIGGASTELRNDGGDVVELLILQGV
jgi:hypothetical protein